MCFEIPKTDSVESIVKLLKERSKKEDEHS